MGHVTQVEAEGSGRAGENVRREEGRRGDVGRPSRELHEAVVHRCGAVTSELQVRVFSSLTRL